MKLWLSSHGKKKRAELFVQRGQGGGVKKKKKNKPNSGFFFFRGWGRKHEKEKTQPPLVPPRAHTAREHKTLREG